MNRLRALFDWAGWSRRDSEGRSALKDVRRTLPLLWVCFFALPSPAADPVEFSLFQWLTNRETRLVFGAPTGCCYRIDVSTNLTEWQSWRSFPMTNRFQQHTDSAAPYWPGRFYVGRQMDGTNLMTGDHLPTAGADVVMHPVYHASLALGWNNITIYVDPATNSFKGLPKADLILFTHDHGDHFNASAISGLTNRGATIIAPQVVYSKLSAAQKSLAIVLTNNMSTNLLGLTILAMPAYNLANSPHARGPNNGYILTVGGRRIYLSGDSENTQEMMNLRDIDAAFLAMNQPYTMTVAQAVSATRSFKPGVVYPCHYRNADGTYADLAAFKRQVGQDLGIEVRLRAWY